MTSRVGGCAIRSAPAASACARCTRRTPEHTRPLIVTVEPPEVAPFTLVADVTIGSTVHTS